MRIRVFEMSYTRKDVMRAIDDHLQQIVENWCLIWVAKNYNKNVETINHWVRELLSQLNPGLGKLRACSFGESAKRRLIEHVLVSDARLDVPHIVYDMLDIKFEQEQLPTAMQKCAADAWVKEGLPQIRQVYNQELGARQLGQELRGESPV